MPLRLKEKRKSRWWHKIPLKVYEYNNYHLTMSLDVLFVVILKMKTWVCETPNTLIHMMPAPNIVPQSVCLVKFSKFMLTYYLSRGSKAMLNNCSLESSMFLSTTLEDWGNMPTSYNRSWFSPPLPPPLLAELRPQWCSRWRGTWRTAGRHPSRSPEAYSMDVISRK